MYACIIGNEWIVRYLIENETCFFRDIEATNEVNPLLTYAGCCYYMNAMLYMLCYVMLEQRQCIDVSMFIRSYRNCTIFD